MKKIFQSLKVNLLVLVLGGVLSGSIFFVIQDPSGFQANVLGIQDKDILQKKEWDLWYKFENNQIIVYLSDRKNYSNVDVEIFYDLWKVEFDLENIEYQGELIERSLDNWVLNLSFELGDFDFDESFFVVPFVGVDENIVLDKASGIIGDKIILFDIWNLNKEMVHH